MRTSYIEQMNVIERNNSLRGYHTQLKQYYTDYITEQSKKEDGKTEAEETSKQNFPFSFHSILQGIEESHKGRKTDKVKFNTFKFQLAKNINLIKRLLYKLCHDTVDSSIVDDETGIETINQAVVWQFVECVDENELDYQDRERIRLILSDEKKKKALDSDKDKRVKIVKEYKSVLRDVLKETFKVLGDLVNFSQYLSVVENLSSFNEEKSDGENSKSGELRFLYDPEAMKHILSLTECVKRIILDYLVSFVKVQRLNLPHSFLKEARFSHSILNESNLMGSDLTGANFERAAMRDCDLSMCAMNGVKAEGADLTRSALDYVNLTGADLSNVVLNEAKLNAVTFFDKGIVLTENYNKNDFILSFVDDNGLVKEKNDFIVTPEDVDLQKDILEKISRNSADPLKEEIEAKEKSAPALYEVGLTQTIDVKIQEVLLKYVKKAKTKCPCPILIAKASGWYAEKGKEYGLNFDLAELTNASVKSSALPNSNFSYLSLAGASFDDTDLNESIFYYNNVVGARFSNANLSKCKMFHSDFQDAALVNANAVQTEFLDCRFASASFERALLIGAYFFNSERATSYLTELIEKYEEPQVWKRIVNKSHLQDKECPGAPTEKGVWRKSVVAHADMEDCNFQHCIASRVAFINMNLDRSMCAFADMKKSFFSNCLLRWVDMFKINFSYALFIGTVFDHSSLNNSLFSNARLFACVFAESNLANANFISSRMDCVSFNNCDLSGANLSNAKFYNCSFTDVNFLNVNISNSKFENCKFYKTNLGTARGFESSSHKNSELKEMEYMDYMKRIQEKGETYKASYSNGTLSFTSVDK